MAVIDASNISKNYGSQQVLSGINLSIEAGKICVLLGPNGAGKTTFIKCLLNLTRLNSGSIQINGIDHRNKLSRRELAFLPEVFTFYPYYTVEETVIFFSLMHGVSQKTIHEELPAALDLFHLKDIVHRNMETLSKGQAQRTALAHIFISNVPILILDEPFTGLDPIGIKLLKDILIKLRDNGKTILLSSHILSELEKFADEFIILHEGKCLAAGPLRSLKKKETLEDFFLNVIEQQEKTHI
jgi:ABC-type multidrug transport system ATPase subunit